MSERAQVERMRDINAPGFFARGGRPAPYGHEKPRRQRLHHGPTIPRADGSLLLLLDGLMRSIKIWYGGRKMRKSEASLARHKGRTLTT